MSYIPSNVASRLAVHTLIKDCNKLKIERDRYKEALRDVDQALLVFGGDYLPAINEAHKIIQDASTTNRSGSLWTGMHS